MTQLVECPNSTQVRILRFVGSSPASGSVLTSQSLEPALDSVSSSLSAPLLLTLCLYLSKINKHFFFNFFHVYLFLRQRQSMNGGESERERETQNLKQAPGSEQSAQSLTRISNSYTARS